MENISGCLKIKFEVIFKFKRHLVLFCELLTRIYLTYLFIQGLSISRKFKKRKMKIYSSLFNSISIQINFFPFIFQV